MKIEDLKLEIDQDLKIDLTNLAIESAENCIKYHKYNKLLLTEKLIYRKLWVEHQKTKKEVYRFYSGYGDSPSPEQFDSSGLKIHMSGEAKILDEQSKLFLIEEKIKFLETTCQNFISRGFSIKNIIELRKLESGN